ncbi:hypothetical protein BC831DRAFT_407205, partial [Entophlyctis helioformis]
MSLDPLSEEEKADLAADLADLPKEWLDNDGWPPGYVPLKPDSEPGGLTADQIAQLKHVLALQFKAFSLDPSKPGSTNVLQATIDTGDSPPVAARTQRFNGPTRIRVMELTQAMLDDDIIEQSFSPWSSPIVLVRKKDGQIRF